MTQPKLEIASAVPSASSGDTVHPLLFVHGAFCGAWIWQENFLPFFADYGIPAYAISLRGHGHSEGYEALRDTSMADYVEDVESTIRTITERHGRPPVLVGHSMGGMVVQRVVENQDSATFKRSPTVAGMVLMSSVPPGGLLGTTLHMLLNDPILFWQMSAIQAFGAGTATVGGIHRAMFSADVPVELTASYLGRLQEESLRVQVDLSTTPPPVATNGKAIPTLVIGADQDSFVPPWMAQMTARHYGSTCIVLENAGHAMMLGTTAGTAANTLLQWLEEQKLL